MSDRDARYSLEDPADSGYQDAYDDVEIEDVEDVRTTRRRAAAASDGAAASPGASPRWWRSR